MLCVRAGGGGEEWQITKRTYFSTSCKIISLDCGLELLPLIIGRRLCAQEYNPTAKSP